MLSRLLFRLMRVPMPRDAAYHHRLPNWYWHLFWRVRERALYPENRNWLW